VPVVAWGSRIVRSRPDLTASPVLYAAEADTALPQVRQYVSAGGGGRAGLGERIPLTTSPASQYA
jgi:hypothetical protein